MYAVQKMEKIFGNNFDEYRFENQIGKSQFVNLNNHNSSSSRKRNDKSHKKHKNNISSFKKLLTKNENDIFNRDKSNISNYIGKIDKIYNSELTKKIKGRVKSNISKYNNIINNQSIINSEIIKNSSSNKNIIRIRNAVLHNKEEQKNNLEKFGYKKKKKKYGFYSFNPNSYFNINYLNQNYSLIEKINKNNFVQNSIQLKIECKNENKYQKLKIEKIQLPIYTIINEKELNNKTKNINIEFNKNISEIGNNFKTIYNVNNKKKLFLCCI